MTDTEKYLAEIKARVEKATEGPWDWPLPIVHQRVDGSIEDIPDADNKFIAHARTDIERLVAMVETLQAKLDLCLRIAIDAKYGSEWVRINIGGAVTDGRAELGRLAAGGGE